MNTPLLNLLSKNWWLVFLRGLFAILFGIAAFSWPGLTLAILIIMWGAYAGLDGIFSIVAAIKGGNPMPRWWLVVSGLLGIGAAAVCFVNPGITAIFLITIIGWWSIIRGVFEIIGALQLRKEIQGEWWLILSGIFSILFGAFIIARPGAGALGLIWIIASFALLFGVILVALSLRLKKHGNKIAG